jgi:CHAD domain-containing protein
MEGVHGMRTATRRLRSDLRTFLDLLDGDWAGPLEDELRWLAGVLGPVRDLDVLEARLREAAGNSADALAPLFRALGARHEAASAALRAALAGERYQALLARLDDALERPSLNDQAGEPCGEALPPLVARVWKSLKKRARALGPDDPEDDFHDVRKRAKRLRYAAEAVAHALDARTAKSARRFAKLATRVQDVLGEFQDAIVAGQEIDRLVAEHPDDGPFNLAAGRLLERQAIAAEQARALFFKVWDKLDRRACRRWLKA